MRFVAFVRNVNQGQRGHPSTADLVAAFANAGCPNVTPFQSNGTLVFDADDPDAVLDAALESLAATAGIERAGFRMDLDRLADLVAAHAGADDAARRELTVHGGGILDPADPRVVREAAHRRCRLLDAGDGWAVFANERNRESNATPVVERLTDAPATSRGLPTLVRLVDRFVG